MSATTKESSNDLNVTLLINTFMKIAPEADGFAATFYQILFDKYPHIKPLFAKTDMAKQRQKLIESLQLVMANVNSSETLDRILQNLGKKHVSYGAVLTDYPLIADALLQALQHHLREDWTPEAESTWISAYQMIAGLMARGAKSMEKETTVIESLEPAKTDHNFMSFINKFDFNKFLIASVVAGTTVIFGYTVWTMSQGSPNTSIEQKQ